MKRNFFISVAIATYNGEKYIKEQINSILLNLCDNDEIIISDDGSTDRTIEIVKKINDKRIKIIDGPKKGLKQNFSNAISNCNGKYIFLSDQDDIWEKNKVDKILKVFEEKKCSCIVHDCTVFNSDTKKIIFDSFYKFRKSGSGFIKNILKNTYIGCCMAFESTLKNKILPIPNNIEMHDQWIGILAEKENGTIFITDKLIKYRRHINNVSDLKHHPLSKMIKNRIIFVKEYIKKRCMK